MINLAKKIFFYIKNEGLVYTAKHIFRFIANPILYKIRPKLMEIQKQKFVKKYNISFPASDIFLAPDYLDLNNLVNQINNHKPKCILELGTGYSTYAMIFALNKLEEKTGHKFEFYAVDQNEWYLNTKLEVLKSLNQGNTWSNTSWPLRLDSSWLLQR